ncbi:hypothetical protein CW304_26325 [Bacillus sp. UFRGS-B20]|nr:hypothetical protein CW304_26325 [Bacillus sp. UFRGS-B20]
MNRTTKLYSFFHLEKKQQFFHKSCPRCCARLRYNFLIKYTVKLHFTRCNFPGRPCGLPLDIPPISLL